MMMAKHARDVMSGSLYEKDWIFHQDALSLMTSKSCIKCMKSTIFEGKTLFERWLLPINGANTGTRYKNKVVGNSPEFMLDF